MTDSGSIYWITGISGVGKTTVAHHLVVALRDLGVGVVHLDGDELRAMLAVEGSYTKEERRKLAFVYVRLCVLLARQGFTVVCSTISLFADVRQWGRKNAPRWLEIHLTAPMSVIRNRDPKGIYAASADDNYAEIAGLHVEVELPENPDLYWENSGVRSPDAARDAILALARRRGFLK